MRRYRLLAHGRTLSGAPGRGRALLFSAILIITFTLRSVPSRASVFDLPADGSAVVGADTTITTHYQDTLLDIARKYSLGYDEIIRANPGVDMWLPGEGTKILLPGRRILPPGRHEGVIVSLPEHRLYYFPEAKQNRKRVVITYPKYSTGTNSRHCQSRTPFVVSARIDPRGARRRRRSTAGCRGSRS
jgi:lipoprotein-anchoring transpeptidase ErfK/SrfK